MRSDPAPEQLLRRTRELRLGLLRLHKTLLDGERTIYERVYGQVNGGELLQLVINHEQFAWLHAFSELIVRINEMLDGEEPKRRRRFSRRRGQSPSPLRTAASSGESISPHFSETRTPSWRMGR